MQFFKWRCIIKLVRTHFAAVAVAVSGDSADNSNNNGNNSTGNGKEQIDLLNQFYKKIKAFEESAIDPTLKNFVEEINLEVESGENGKIEFDPEQGPDMVKIMTIHGAKGLEFKYVFIVNMVDKRFPTISRGELIELPEDLIKDIKPIGDIHLQEERRLCYVAMTRAKKELYFTSAQDYGGVQKKKISRFLMEMGYKEKKQNTKHLLGTLNYETLLFYKNMLSCL